MKSALTPLIALLLPLPVFAQSLPDTQPLAPNPNFSAADLPPHTESVL